MNIKHIRKKREIVFSLILVIVSAILILTPTGFAKAIYFNATGAKAKVISTDDTSVIQTGLFRQGDQRCIVQVLSGPHKGLVMEGVNMLSGSLAQDKMFKSGETAWVLIERDSEDNPVFINMVDHYRLSKEFIAAVVFIILMIVLAGTAGVRIIVSFIFAFIAIWRLLVPGVLNGINPMLLSAITLMAITTVTLILVAGINRTSLAAIIGALLSSLITTLIGFLMTHWMQIHGSVLEMSESLLYSGFMSLDLTSLFIGTVVLSSGGAIMDLAIDVSVAMSEVKEHSKEINSGELFRSGLAVGRAGVGTQTTTLLLAYMGAWLSVMMVYMAQGTPPLNILTGKVLASEIVQTLTGCTGLILVTPLTAFVSSVFLTSKRH